MMVKVWEGRASRTEDGPPRTEDWRVVFRDEFGTDGGWKAWSGSWEVRGGTLRGRQAETTYGAATFSIAQATRQGLVLPRTVEVRFRFRADKPVDVGVHLVQPSPLRIYGALLCGKPIPFGRPCTKLQALTDPSKLPTYIGRERPFRMPTGRWQHVRFLREGDRVRVYVGGEEVLAERIPNVDLPALMLDCSWGAVGDEVEFKDLEVRVPGEAAQ
jgi:hypothetical protein